MIETLTNDVILIPHMKFPQSRHTARNAPLAISVYFPMEIVQASCRLSITARLAREGDQGTRDDTWRQYP